MGQTRFIRQVRMLTTMASLVATGSAWAATTVLTPAQDTSIFNGSQSSDNLADGAGASLWLSVTSSGLNRRILVKFDLSALPKGAVVQQVQLTLYESRARDGHEVSLHRLLSSWGEGASNGGDQGSGVLAQAGDATWKHRFYPSILWTRAGGDWEPAPSAVTLVGPQDSRYAWTGAVLAASGPVPLIVADVQRWVDDPASNHGWIFMGAEGGNGNGKRFGSRSNLVFSQRPQLSVTWAEPSAAANDTDVPIPPWAVGSLGALLAALRVRHMATRRGEGCTLGDRR